MPKSKSKSPALIVLLLLFGAPVCMASPSVSATKSEPTAKAHHTKNSKPIHSKSISKEEDNDTKPLFDDEAANTNVAEFAKEYAALMKKATAAIQINRPLKMDEEKRLWADYKSGKYAKNKEFMRNMKLAEPYHNRLRSILHVFESQKFKKLDFSHPAPIQENQSSTK